MPNLITASRLALVGPLGVMLWHSGRAGELRWAAIGLFVWIALSDGLDGFLARRWSAFSRLGRVLDPAADKLAILVSFVILAWVGAAWHYYWALPPWLVAVVVGKDLWLVIGFAVLALMGVPLSVQPNVFGKASTALQLLLVLTTLFTPEASRLGLRPAWEVLVWLTLAATLAAGASYTWHTVAKLAAWRFGRN